jgi:hypothetical protein
MLPMWSAPVTRFVDVTAAIVLIVIAIVAAVVAFVMLRGRRVDSSVDSFRRHIDALGPEARRTTVDQVQTAAAREESADATATEPPVEDDPGDEDGARGT